MMALTPNYFSLRPLRRKSSNSSLRSVNSVSSISSISSIASLSGGLNSLRNKLKGKMKRKRKMCDEECSGKSKRKRHGSFGNITNLSSVVTPGRVKSASGTLTRTNSLRMIRSPTTEFIKPYSGPALTPSKVREHMVWQKTVDPFVLEHMPPALVRRQEAIYELLQGEKELVEDLTLVLKVFHGPMKQLGLVSEGELSLIFGNIEELVSVHQSLVDKLIALQNQIGVYDSVAETVTEWIPTLHCYSAYCSNQIYAKEVFDQISQKSDVADFLERCRASSFSRKLDLWSFLDTPRRRLPKYVLLIKNIVRMTLPTHADKMGLQRAIEGLHTVLSAVDKATGRAKCDKYKSRLVFLQDKHDTTDIQSATSLLCDGPLKNKNGTKVHGLLFDTVFLLTRQLQKEKIHYQVYRTPISVSDIEVEDLPEVRVGGSFKRTFSTTSSGDVSKNFFRVWEGDSQGYTLSVQSGTKKQWIDSILNAKKALSANKMLSPRSLPAVPRLEINSTVGAGNDVTAQNDDVVVPATPTVSRPTSPPLEFITPQAKQPKSRTSSLVDYTPTEEGGKKLREALNVDPCGTPNGPLRTPVSRMSDPGTPTSNQENCLNTINQMTPFSATSPKLMLRTDEHVLRLVMDEAPASSPTLTKTSTV
ncbi:hypothetical protein ACHWQZ_G009237 [Mnemiopsis leidyi]